MAAPTLKKPKPLRLTNLQALLLSGGAFVLATGVWFFSTHRLVTDPGPLLENKAVGAITFIGKPAHIDDFIDALPEEAQSLLVETPLNDRAQTTIFAYGDTAEEPHWSLLKDAGSTRRWIRRDVQAFGFLEIGGLRQPFSASFSSMFAAFDVGRTYRGVLKEDPKVRAGRRMNVQLPSGALYVEKPEKVSWKDTASALHLEMPLFSALSDFWKLPGRIEFLSSASRTNDVLQPFSLYYRPPVSTDLPVKELEELVAALLADAAPSSIEIQMPDGSRAQELRHDSGSIQIERKRNQFGEIVKFSSHDALLNLFAFHADDGEFWLTTDLKLVQAILFESISGSTSPDKCHEGSFGGFASIPGHFIPFSQDFKHVNLSIHNFETGLFTICGYYR